MNATDFGKTKDGVQAHLYTIKNDTLECRVTDFGSILVSLFAPDKYGSSRDVVLGFDDVSGYENDTASLGCNVGRCANRIGGASFTLNGTTCTLDKNDGENCLHSGFHQYSKRIWTVKEHTDTAITLTLNSPDMDPGFPGSSHHVRHLPSGRKHTSYLLRSDSGQGYDHQHDQSQLF